MAPAVADSDVPDEFRYDPELYYAIQESLGLASQPTESARDNLSGWDRGSTGNEIMHSNTSYVPLKQRKSSGDDLSNKNNESMDHSSNKMLLDDDDDDDSGFPIYNQSPSKLQKDNRKNHAKVVPII